MKFIKLHKLSLPEERTNATGNPSLVVMPMTGYKKTKLLAATVRSGRMSKRTLFGQLGLLYLYCAAVVGVVNCGVVACGCGGVPGSYAACAHSLCLPHFVCEHAATLNRSQRALCDARRIDIFAKFPGLDPL